MKTKLPWLRLYTEIIDDEKLLLLAFEDRWHYIALLACKGRGILDKDEAPDLMFRKVSLKLGLARREMDEVARRLADAGLIDQATLQPLAWDDRQFRSDTDPTAADRKRRQRERERTGASGVTNESPVTGTDVPRTDTDTDTDTKAEDQKPPKPPAGSKTEGADALFERAMSEYPKRAGGDSRVDALKAWKARIKAGAKPEDIIDGVKRYAAYIRARCKEHTEFVKRSCTFFGPGEHWKADYTIPKAANGEFYGTSNSGRRESEAERVERINREHDEREHASGMF